MYVLLRFFYDVSTNKCTEVEFYPEFEYVQSDQRTLKSEKNRAVLKEFEHSLIGPDNVLIPDHP